MITGRRLTLMIVAGICLALWHPLDAQTPDEAIGFWKTVDSRKHFTTSIMAVYTYEEMLYGRIIVSFDEKSGALLETHHNAQQQIETVPGRPKLLEVDLFWNLRWEQDRYKGGTVLDPRSGRSFACESYVKDQTFILRGKIGPFGMNSVFYRALPEDFPAGYTPPDVQQMRPKLPISQ